MKLISNCLFNYSILKLFLWRFFTPYHFTPLVQKENPKKKTQKENPRVYYVLRYEPALLNIGGGNQVLETGVSKDFQGIMKTGSKLRFLSGSK